MRFIMPFILIGISITVFFLFSNPFYKDVIKFNAQLESYNKALDNSKALTAERDKLTQKKSSMNPADLAKLQKFLPDNVDNIRLILEIEQVAKPYNMFLKDVKYSATTEDTTKNTTGGNVAVVKGGRNVQSTLKDYGIWDLEFSTTGSYANFISFMKDLEKNLRIVDISSIQFSSSETSKSGSNASSSAPESYKYSFKIKTYWLKK